MRATSILLPAHPPAQPAQPTPPSSAARTGAAGLFLAAVLILVVAHRRLRARVRVDEADAALRADFERLERLDDTSAIAPERSPPS